MTTHNGVYTTITPLRDRGRLPPPLVSRVAACGREGLCPERLNSAEKQKSSRRRHAVMRHSPFEHLGVLAMGRYAVNTMLRIEEVLAERISPDTETGCFLWTGYKNNVGYGQIEVDGKIWLAHRLSWTVRRGPIPKGLLVLHKCDTPLCVNPEHLFLGTHKDNSADMMQKGRFNARSLLAASRKRRIRKLTDDQVREIRVATGTVKDIARRFGLRSHSTVCDIRNGKRKTLVE